MFLGGIAPVPSDDSGSSGLSGGAIFGIIFAVLLAVGLAVGAYCYYTGNTPKSLPSFNFSSSGGATTAASSETPKMETQDTSGFSNPNIDVSF